MNIINIFPNNLISPNMIRQKYELYLAYQILKESSKFEFLKENNGFSYKILDNSAYELGYSLKLDDLLKAASVIKADEIVLPDVFKSNESYDKTMEALDFLKDTDYKLAAVAQGKNIYDLQTYLDKLLKEKRIDTIMLPKWSGQYRSALTQTILTSNVNKQIHWLGLSNSLKDVVKEPIRSIDTGYFTALASTNLNQSIFDDRQDIEINLDCMDVDLNKLKNLIAQQQEFTKGEINV